MCKFFLKRRTDSSRQLHCKSQRATAAGSQAGFGAERRPHPPLTCTSFKNNEPVKVAGRKHVMSSISKLSGLGPHQGSWFLGQQLSCLWFLQSGGQDESTLESRLQGPHPDPTQLSAYTSSCTLLFPAHTSTPSSRATKMATFKDTYSFNNNDSCHLKGFPEGWTQILLFSVDTNFGRWVLFPFHR